MVRLTRCVLNEHCCVWEVAVQVFLCGGFIQCARGLTCGGHLGSCSNTGASCREAVVSYQWRYLKPDWAWSWSACPGSPSLSPEVPANLCCAAIAVRFSGFQLQCSCVTWCRAGCHKLHTVEKLWEVECESSAQLLDRWDIECLTYLQLGRHYSEPDLVFMRGLDEEPLCWYMLRLW